MLVAALPWRVAELGDACAGKGCEDHAKMRVCQDRAVGIGKWRRRAGRRDCKRCKIGALHADRYDARSLGGYAKRPKPRRRLERRTLPAATRRGTLRGLIATRKAKDRSLASRVVVSETCGYDNDAETDLTSLESRPLRPARRPARIPLSAHSVARAPAEERERGALGMQPIFRPLRRRAYTPGRVRCRRAALRSSRRRAC